MYEKLQGQKIHKKKVIQHLPTWIPVRKISLLPTLTPSQGLKKISFLIKFFSWDHKYVDYMCEKFQVQKTHTKIGMRNVYLPRNFLDEIIFMLITCMPNSKLKRITQEKIC